MMYDARAYLHDMLRAGRRIVEVTSPLSREEFLKDWRPQSLVERQFTIIGEALNRLVRLEPAYKARITDCEKIIAFRNIVVHGYVLIDQPRVWDFIEQKLPTLIGEVEQLFEELS